MAKKKAGTKGETKARKGRPEKDEAPKERLKKAALKRVEKDVNLGKYSKTTRERVAGLAARMAAELAEGKDGEDLLRETTKIQTGTSAGAYSAEKLNGLVKQRDPKDVNYKKLKEMRENGHVQLGLTAVKAPMIRALSPLPPILSDDPEVAAFVRAALLPVWKSLVRSSSNAEDFGYLPHEKRFKTEDIEWSWPVTEGDKTVIRTASKKGAWLPKRYKDIDPDGVKIWLDEETGAFGGFTEKGAHTIEELTPADKAFVYTVGKEFGNLFGKSRLARAYDPYVHYSYAEFFQGRYFERFGEPGIKVRFDPNPVIDASGTRENEPGEQALAAAVNYKGSGVVGLPSTFDDDGNPLNDLDIIHDDRRGEVWVALLEFWLKQILRSLLITDRTLTQDTRLGSYGMAKAHTETFLDSLQESVESFIDQVNLYIVPQLIELSLGKNRAKAYLQVPRVSREYEAILVKIFEQLVKEEPSVREAIDYLEILRKLNIPMKGVEEEGSADEDIEAAMGLEAATTSSISDTAASLGDSLADLAKGSRALDQMAKGMMATVEKDLDKVAEPVREKIFGYESLMKKVALDFLREAKVDDAGRLKKVGNERALKVALKKIDGIADEMETWFASKEDQRASNYLATFGDQGIEDFGKLADEYEITLPKGWKSTIREEKLARSFGAGLRSFLENIGRVATRTKSGIREILISGIDRHEVINAVKRNGRFMRHAAERSLSDAVEAMRGVTKKATQRIVDAIPALERTAKDSTKLWASGMLGAATGAVAALKLNDEQTEEVEKAAVDAVDQVKAVKPLSEEDTLQARVENTNTHRGYVDLTVEGPARGAYRWALWAGAALAGWDVWKFFKGSKTTEVKGKPAASSERYAGMLGTTNWWEEEGRKEGVEEPLQLYLFHYGDRDYAFPMPREWAEARTLEFKKVGGE